MSDNPQSPFQTASALNGALLCVAGCWTWKDGTPEPRVRHMLLRDLAPNFRCIPGWVEIPHNWRSPNRWPNGRVDADAERAIKAMISAAGKSAPIYADGLAEALDDHRMQVDGHVIPIDEWNHQMTATCGVWWSTEHETEILSRAAQLTTETQPDPPQSE